MRAGLTLLLALAAAGCGHAERSHAGGPPVSRAFPVTAFAAVALLGPDDVLVATGPTPGVRAEGDQEAIDALSISVVGGELRIGRIARDGESHGKAKVMVTVPGITGARIAGAGDLSIDRVATPRFDAAVSGAGDLAIGALEARQARFTLSGAGSIAASGRATTLALELSGAGEIDAAKLAADTVTVENRGTGAVHANAKTRAEVTLSGVGSVRIDGKPQCTVRKTGVGEVDCG